MWAVGALCRVIRCKTHISLCLAVTDWSPGARYLQEMGYSKLAIACRWQELFPVFSVSCFCGQGSCTKRASSMGWLFSWSVWIWQVFICIPLQRPCWCLLEEGWLHFPLSLHSLECSSKGAPALTVLCFVLLLHLYFGELFEAPSLQPLLWASSAPRAWPFANLRRIFRGLWRF